VRTLRKPSLAEKKNLLEKRQRLQTRIIKFEKKLSALDIMDNVESGDLVRVGVSKDEEDEEFSDDEEEVQNTPERVILLLPSNLIPNCRNRLGLEGLSQQEAELRIGQMNDALQQLKVALGGKSLIMRKKVRIFSNKFHMTKSL
jgi:hypothetical protein